MIAFATNKGEKMTIPAWVPIVEGEIDTTKNMQRLALSLDGVVQHILVVTTEIAALLVENPTITLLPSDSAVKVGQRLL